MYHGSMIRHGGVVVEGCGEDGEGSDRIDSEGKGLVMVVVV